MNNTLLTCKDVSFAYDGNVVIEGLNFQVSDGDYLSIVGENGSGKSTLIKGLLRLIKPCRGSIALSDELKVNEVGYLPQQTAAQKDFPASVYEVVLSGRINGQGLHLFYSKEDKKLAIENMERLDVLHLKNKCYRELSGGQQQRVLLCRAICAAKKLLILDEPAASLDPIATNELYKTIKNINSKLKITIIMVSHDIDGVVKYSSHILHLKNKQVFFGTREEYKDSDIIMSLAGGQGL